MVSKAFLDKVKSEVKNDKKTYLKNCEGNPSEYGEAVHWLFGDVRAGRGPDKTNVIKAVECEEKKDTEGAKNYFKLAVEDRVDTPYPYEKLAALYLQEGKLKEAGEVCKKWFDLPYWKIADFASAGLRIIEMMEKTSGHG